MRAGRSGSTRVRVTGRSTAFTDRFVWLGAAAVTLVGLVARLIAISAKPFWMDEVTTLDRSALPLRGLLQSSLQNHHLPTYFLLAGAVQRLGNSELWLRLPSVICGALCCGMVTLITRRLGGGKAGLLAGLLMALSPLQVQYGQEARSYTLVTALILLALLGLIGLALNPERAALPVRAPGAARRDWGLLLFGTAAALNVLSVALLWWLAANLAVVVIAWRLGVQRRSFARNWLIVQGLAAASCLPWFVAMYCSVRGHDMRAGLDWVPPVSVKRIWSAVAAVYLLRDSSLISGRLLYGMVPLVGPLLEMLVGALAACGVAFLALRRPTALAPILLSVLTLPLALLTFSLVQPMWMPRYILWSGAPFFILAGLGLAALPPRLSGGLVLGIAGLAAINLWPYYAAETKPRWDLAAAELHAGRQPGDLVLVSDYWGTRLLNVYLNRTGDPLVGSGVSLQLSDAPARIAQGNRVWVVLGRIGQTEDVISPTFRRQLAALGTPAIDLQAGQDVTIRRYDPPLSSLACAASSCDSSKSD